MNDNDFKRRLRRFEREHGTECYADDAGTLYYRTGAWREPGAMGIMAAPPDAVTAELEYRRAQNILKFYQLRLDARVAKFTELRDYLDTVEVENQDEKIEELKQLQKLVEDAKPAVRAAERALSKTKWGQALINQRENEEQRRESFRRWRGRIRAIRI